MRLVIDQNFAFLHNPNYLELEDFSGQVTYVIDWGRQEQNDMIARDIESASEGDAVFHTFVCPKKKVSIQDLCLCRPALNVLGIRKLGYI